MPPPPVLRGLVRDPYAKLGGVASGLAHHFGLDVSLVRIAFVLFTVFTGIGLPLYLAAWLIVPRAEYWPPIGNAGRSTRHLSGREVALGLIAVGGLLVLFFNGGQFTSVMVPLALILGGIWLLLQPAADRSVAESPTVGGSTAGGPAAGNTMAGGAQPQDTPGWSAWAAPTAATRSPYDQPSQSGLGSTGSVPPSGRPPGSPVTPSRRRRRIGYLAAAGLVLLVAVPITIIALVSAGSISITADGGAIYRPATVEAIPRTISHDAGEIVIDLTDLEPAMFDDLDPVSISVEHGVGEILVEVPEGVVVDATASAGVGDIDIFDSSSDGIAPELSVPAADPDIVLDIVVGVGDVNVVIDG